MILHSGSQVSSSNLYKDQALGQKKMSRCFFRVCGSKSSQVFRMHPKGVLTLVGELPIYRKKRKRHPLCQFPTAGREKPHLLTPIGQEKPHLLALRFGWLCDWQPKVLSVSQGAGIGCSHSGLTRPLRADLVFPTFSYPSVSGLWDFGGDRKSVV